MNPSTSPFTSPVKSERNCTTCRTPQTPETPTRARTIGKADGRGKGMSRKISFSKIPSSDGSTRSHASSSLRTSPITFAPTGKMSLRYKDRNTPSISSSDSGSPIREKIAEAMATNQFATPDCDIPISPQNDARTAAKMNSPPLDKGKSLPTTDLSPPEPVIMKGIISHVGLPQVCSEPMASPAIPKPVLTSNASSTSSTNTLPKVSTAPSVSSATCKPAGSNLSRIAQKQTQSTPLLPKRHRSSTGSSRHVVSTSAPSEFYEYHTINGIIDLPFASKKSSSGDSSGYDSGVSGSESIPSSSSSLKNIYSGFLHSVRPRVLGAYILCGSSIIWLVWMTLNKIFTDNKGNPDRGHGGIGGHVPPFGMRIPTLTASFPTHSIGELMPVDKSYLSTGNVNDRQISHDSHKSPHSPPSKHQPEETFRALLWEVFVTLAWLLGIIFSLIFVRELTR
ncbi:hypothetical protein EAE96_003641 [Botrytis aclada]|nr:hypothetical protein EAE96_003641 [Botrytis aclada]